MILMIHASVDPADAHTPAWPVKRRELQNHTMDSVRWNGFRFREGDIVVASWAKAGTTWVQQILGQLIFAGAENLPVLDLCPWIEQRFPPIEQVLERVEAQHHRRFVKTHLPADAVTISPRARYLYIGRDGRDAAWSWHHHHRRMTQHAFDLLNGAPGRVGPPLGPACEDVRQFFHEWLDGDGYPIWPFWSNISTWWNLRGLPNVLLVHFNNLKRDLPAEIRRIARFLEIELPDELWPRVFEHCTFEYMKAHGASLAAFLSRGFKGGANDFIYRGTNGRWRDVLTAEDVRKYEDFAARNLSPACGHWLAGSRPDGSAGLARD
jgi:aryl sulfotransferase